MPAKTASRQRILGALQYLGCILRDQRKRTYGIRLAMKYPVGIGNRIPSKKRS